MKLSTVFVEGMYRCHPDIHSFTKYVLQETLVNIIGDTCEFFFICAPNTIIIAKIKNGDITGS